MKNLLFTLFLFTWANISLQAQTDYKQWETHRFKVKMGHSENFEKGLAAHNKKYHNAAPYKTGIFDITTGPNSGEYELVMGPMTFTQMDGRPSGTDHDADWAKVLEHVESVGETIFWRADKDILYAPEGSDAFTAMRWRYNTIRPDQRDRFTDLMKQVEQVFETKKMGAGFAAYWRYGASQGPHVCTELSMPGLKYFDREDTWVKEFEEVHGEGSYDRYIEDLNLCVDRTKTYDEFVKFRTDLSSDY
ncbi:MAG: hypothetical protein SH808_09895 [Saprospiraceae bacterium]|nr:hypothetical protein [Saprospiraceae bacterium]